MPKYYDADLHKWIQSVPPEKQPNAIRSTRLDGSLSIPPAPIPAEHAPSVSQPPQPPQDPSYGLNGMDLFNKQKHQNYVQKGVGCLLMLPALILTLRWFLPLLAPLMTWDFLAGMGVIFALLFGFFLLLPSDIR